MKGNFTHIDIGHQSGYNFLSALFFLFIVQNVNSEPEKNKLEALISISDSLLDNYQYEEAISYLFELKNFAASGNDLLNLRKANSNLGFAFYFLGEYEESLLNYQNALEINIKLGEKIKTIRTLKSIGMNYQMMGLYGLSLESYFLALDYARQENNMLMIAELKNSIAIVYRKSGELDSAIETQKESLSVYIEEKDSLNISYGFNNLAICFLELDLIDSSLYYNFRALEIKRNLNLKKETASSLNNIGDIYLRIDSLVKSYPFLVESLELHQGINDIHGVLINNNNLISYWLKKKKPENALPYLIDSEGLFAQVDAKQVFADYLNQKIKYYEIVGNHEQALEYYVLWDKVKYELFQEERLNVKELSNLFLLKEKEYQKNKIEQESEILSIRNKLYKSVSILSWSLAFISFTLLTIIYRNFKIKKKQADLITDQNKIILTQQAELRHRTANFLARARSLIKEIERGIFDEYTKSQLQKSIRILTTAASLERYLINISNEDEVPFRGFLSGLIDEYKKLNELESRNVGFSLILEKDFSIPVKQMINCGFLLSELISNSLKHAFNSNQIDVIPQINIEVTLRFRKIIIHFRDNGKGFEINGVGNGFGSELISRFIGFLQADIQRTNSNGTNYTISFLAEKILVADENFNS